MKYYVGWDVGAWHCENGDSRDALCVLKLVNGEPEFIGTPWRGNLRETLNNLESADLLRTLLSCCGIRTDFSLELTIAIDTPLGWPQAVIRLLTGHPAVESPESFRQNPYLFRETERMLAEHGFQPLSCVQDRIGSQSTKGLHFLRTSRSHLTGTGVWRASDKGVQAEIIETYPSPCEHSPTFSNSFGLVKQTGGLQNHLQGRAGNHRNDVLDALRCAIVAWLYAERNLSLTPPTPDIPSEEGWIWIPTDAHV